MKKYFKLKTVLLSLLFLTVAAVLVMASFLSVDWFLDKRKEDACLDAYSLLCVKARTCGAVDDINKCDKLVLENNFCEVELPEPYIIKQCELQLRQIVCTDQMPPVCNLFMEQ